jgi:hypothetical protein
MSETPLPNPKDVRDMLVDLLGRDVSVNVTDPMELTPDRPACFAVYVDNRVQTVVIIVADLSLAAYTGAAIGLIPAGGASDAIKERSLPKMLSENFAEVLSVGVGLFNVEGAPHLKLYATYGPDDSPPTDVLANAKVLGKRLDLAVNVAGYGSGHLSVVVAP